jgi:DNA processing protein
MHHTTTNHQQTIDWIRLARSQNVGKATFPKLIKIFGNASNALDNIADFSLKGGLSRPIKVYSETQALKEIESCNKAGARIITTDSSEYPRLLKEIADPPPVLTIKGRAELLNKNTLSVVGPRNSSINGCKFSTQIAANLGKRGFVVASGLARGIDTAAHKGSLETGTIAVIAGGIDNIYPKENAQLYHQIANQGVIISENAFGMAPHGGNFPQRNRIISGIALGLIVVEATLRSGTLITARFALEQNREIFAVPGSPFDPRHQGTNRLIKQGAKLIENIDDVLEDLIINEETQMQFYEPEQEEFIGFASKIPSDAEIIEARELILSKIDYNPISADEIIDILQIPAKIVNIVLVQLELADKIEYKGGKVCVRG